MSVILGKVFGAIAQLLLGRWITDEQYGDLAIVVSVAAIVKVLQDGGVPQVLIQRGEAEFSRLMGPAFWLSIAFGVVSGGLLAIAAPLLAAAYETPSLTGLLLVVALSLPIGAGSTILRAKLRVDLRFQTIALIAVFWFLIRHSCSVGLAALGFGAMSVAAPIVIVAVYEWIADYWATRLTPWRMAFGFEHWRGLVGSSFWVGAAAVNRGLARNGDYLMLGLLLPMGVVGKYFFSYQFTTQVLDLLATNLQHVLFPALSRVAGDPERQARAIVRSIRMLMFVAAPVSVGLAVIASPLITILDDLVWNHRWLSTIGLIQVFAVTAPIRMFTELLTAALSSRGQFRGSAGLLLVEGVWLMISAALAVAISGSNLTGVAIVISVAQATFSIGSSIYLLRRFGIDWRKYVAAFLPGWLCALASGGCAAAALTLLPPDVSQYARLGVAGVSFTGAFAVLARLFLLNDLIEFSGLTPAALARWLRRLWLLPAPRGAYDERS